MPAALRVLDLFSGIGGFALGFERVGMRTVAFCEQDPFCREWLAQHWPGVPIYPDVRTLDGRAVGFADVVCGGFPCQDISTAGTGAGLAGARSGLWFQMHRIVSEVRPLWVVIENVPRLRTLGADRVVSDMEALGYTGWFHVVGGDDVGAPHRRKRAWGIFCRLADAHRDALRDIEQRMPRGWQERVRHEGETIIADDGAGLADADGEAGGYGDEPWDAEPIYRPGEIGTGQAEPRRHSGDVADAARDGFARGPARERTVDGSGGSGWDLELGQDAREAMADGTGRGQRAGGCAPGETGHVDLGDAGLADAAGERPTRVGGRGQERTTERREAVADGDSWRRESEWLKDDREFGGPRWDIADGRGSTWPGDSGHGAAAAGVDDAVDEGLQGHARHVDVHRGTACDGPTTAAGVRARWPAGPGQPQHAWEAERTASDAECRLGAAADGLPPHLGPTLNKARLKAAGNSIIPDIAECIGRVIVRLTP